MSNTISYTKFWQWQGSKRSLEGARHPINIFEHLIFFKRAYSSPRIPAYYCSLRVFTLAAQYDARYADKRQACFEVGSRP